MITLAALRKATLAPAYGVKVDADFASTLLAHPVAFSTEIPKVNVPMTTIPWVTVAREFDVTRQAFIGLSVSKDGKYVNYQLTNEAPLSDVEKLPEVQAAFSVRYDAPDANRVQPDLLKALTALMSPKKK